MEDFPKYSADLLVLLSKEIPRPQWPATAAGAALLDDKIVRQYIWFAAQRALIDSLLEQLETAETTEDDDADDSSFWTSDAGPRVIPAALDIRTASIGVAQELDPRVIGAVPD